MEKSITQPRFMGHSVLLAMNREPIKPRDNQSARMDRTVMGCVIIVVSF